MPNVQFRVLYREFLFRMVDLELLSAQGDMAKLLGQFASILLFVSVLMAMAALFFDAGKMTPDQVLNATLGMEHSLIATTMLVVGLFAVLSWDSTFPDRRDVLVLAPLPIRTRTLFAAKVAASASALALTVGALNSLSGIAWPFALADPKGGVLSQLIGLIRPFFAYWTTVLAAGAFVFAGVLGLQGIAAQLLPRRIFLRISALLQLSAFCLFVTVFFLEPTFSTLKALSAPENQSAIASLPSYWFLGLFQMLNGSTHPAFAPLANRALLSLGVTVVAAATAFILSYVRTLRRIVEEPDIVPLSRRFHWEPHFGNNLITAVLMFSVRTLLRSRQHRVMMSFYLGVGFALVVVFLRTPVALKALTRPGPISGALMLASIVMMCCAVVGMRIVFSLPLALRSNWVFQITAVRSPGEYLAAIRKPLFVLAVAPVWLISAAAFLTLWPWRPAAGHLLILGLFGTILAYFCLENAHKIPFTCSYLPGKANFNITLLLCLNLLLLVLTKAVQYELRAMADKGTFAAVVAVMLIVAIYARWRTVAPAKSGELQLRFEERPSPAVYALNLHRDGTAPVSALEPQ